MKLSEQQILFTKNVVKLINYIFEEGYYCTFGECYRSKEQAQIYAKEGKGIADSLHCKRLAIDLNIFSSEGDYLSNSDDYIKFGKYWEQLNLKNRWGGNFGDGNHFEQTL